ncbi:MAG: hypothetical protein ACK5NK_09235 [Niabella sp.]
MLCQTIIPVSEILSTNIHTRESSAILMHAIDNSFCEIIDLDFQDVTYISRSFADQFHFDKMQLVKCTAKKIFVINANDQVINMLQSVSKTQNKEIQLKETQIRSFSSFSSLKTYLLSLG